MEDSRPSQKPHRRNPSGCVEPVQHPGINCFVEVQHHPTQSPRRGDGQGLVGLCFYPPHLHQHRIGLHEGLWQRGDGEAAAHCEFEGHLLEAAPFVDIFLAPAFTMRRHRPLSLSPS